MAADPPKADRLQLSGGGDRRAGHFQHTAGTQDFMGAGGLSLDKEFCNQVHKKMFATLPNYTMLWGEVRERTGNDSFSISLDDVRLTNTNTISQLRAVVREQEDQPAVQLVVAELPDHEAAGEVEPREQPRDAPVRTLLTATAAVGALLGGVGAFLYRKVRHLEATHHALTQQLATSETETKALQQEVHRKADNERALHQQLAASKTRSNALQQEVHRKTQNEKSLSEKLTAANGEKDVKEGMIKELVKQQRTNSLTKRVKRYQEVDLLFVVDCTGSMQPYIDAVKTSIRSMVQRLLTAYPQLNLQLGFLGYRDVGDQQQFQILDFTQSHATFEGFVAKMTADGGADAAEDVAGALRRVADFKWTKHVRVLFHIADAPCHGREYHQGVSDDFPDGVGVSIPEQLMKLRSLKIDYYFGRIKGLTDQMITAFNQHVKQSCGTDPYIKTVGIEHPLDVEEAVVESVCTSIDVASLAAHEKSEKKVVKLETEMVLSSEKPEWHLLESQEPRRGRRISFEVPTSIAACLLVRETSASTVEVDFVVHAVRFAAGMSRLCHWGSYRTGAASGAWSRVVFKQFLRKQTHSGPGCSDEEEGKWKNP
ncbi:vwkA [Symbiodinium sp. CCMP2592]|nr:vwkA [Symbiodinium sp. CCMP2592]